MNLRVLKQVAAVLAVCLFIQPALFGASIPSKSSNGQDLAERANDLALARARFAVDRLSSALSAEGLDAAQIQSRVALLSTMDLIALGQNPAQVRSAGVSMSRKMWTAVGIGAGAVVIGGLALSQKDDGEDEDGSDDGED